MTSPLRKRSTGEPSRALDRPSAAHEDTRARKGGKGPAAGRPRGGSLPLAASALALALAAAGRAEANNGISLTSFSPKSLGRGGAEVAVGEDGLTSPSNPATMIDARGLRIDGSLTVFIERVRSTSRFEDKVTTSVFEAPFPSFAASWDPLAEDPTAEVPDPAPSGLRMGVSLWQPVALVFSPTFTIAAQITDTFAIGASIHPLVTYLNLEITGTAGGVTVVNGKLPPPDFVPNGTVRIFRRPDGTIVDPPEPYDAGTGTPITWGEIFTLANGLGADPNAAPPPPSLRLFIEGMTGFGIMGQIGAFWKPMDELAVGASFRTPGIVYSPKGSGRVDLSPAVDSLKANAQVSALLDAAFETFLPLGGAKGYEAEYDVEATSLKLPMVLTAGVAIRPWKEWLIACDFRYIAWTQTSSEITLKGQKGTNEDFNELNGGPELEYTVELEWEDAFIVALGTAYAVTDWLAVRAGINHGNNPLSDDFILDNSLATETHLTCGLGVLFGDGWEADLAYMYGVPTRIEYNDVRRRSTSEQYWIMVGLSRSF